MTRGKFITFEGGDASGKSTQAALLEQYLQQQNISVVRTREPGGTDISERIRAVALHEEGLDGVSETLLMFAARREHITRKIAPALDAGQWVICDRFTDSTIAYQGGGRGIARALIDELARHVQQGIAPDLTFFLQSPPSSSSNPLFARESFERENEEFYRRVNDAYQQLARAEQHRIVLIDNASKNSGKGGKGGKGASNNPRRDRDSISAEIQQIVNTRLLQSN